VPVLFALIFFDKHTESHMLGGVLWAPPRPPVTALDGDRATLIEFAGSTRTLELSGVADKPRVGDLVAVRGTASGDVLVVERLRRLSR
ncbi:hypothetical protein ACFXGA_05035, partial [Actinosynnema sp. NPDC059335]|uniref:hypothetical protein n=1 Tax=Actinosynnema sp. NPDC059335 TaxID=3346804 RepID=UPI00366D9B1E